MINITTGSKSIRIMKKPQKIFEYASLAVVRMKRIRDNQDFDESLSTATVEGPEFAFGYIYVPASYEPFKTMFIAFRDGKIITEVDITSQMNALEGLEWEDWENGVKSLSQSSLEPVAAAIIEQASNVIDLRDFEKSELAEFLRSREMGWTGIQSGGFSANLQELYPESWIQSFGEDNGTSFDALEFGSGSESEDGRWRAALQLDDTFAGGLIVNGSNVTGMDGSGIQVELEGKCGVAVWQDEFDEDGNYIGAYSGLNNEWVAARRLS